MTKVKFEDMDQEHHPGPFGEPDRGERAKKKMKVLMEGGGDSSLSSIEPNPLDVSSPNAEHPPHSHASTISTTGSKSIKSNIITPTPSLSGCPPPLHTSDVPSPSTLPAQKGTHLAQKPRRYFTSEQRYLKGIFSKENIDRVFGYGPATDVPDPVILPEGYASVAEFRDSLTMLARGDKLPIQLYEQQLRDAGRETDRLGPDWPGIFDDSVNPEVDAGDHVVQEHQIQQMLQVLTNKELQEEFREAAGDILPGDMYSGVYKVEGYRSNQTKCRLAFARREDGTVETLRYSYGDGTMEPAEQDNILLCDISLHMEHKQKEREYLLAQRPAYTQLQAQVQLQVQSQAAQAQVQQLRAQAQQLQAQAQLLQAQAHRLQVRALLQVQAQVAQAHTQNMLARQKRPSIGGQGSPTMQSGMNIGGGTCLTNVGTLDFALDDYQTQLMLLEQQNKQRLLMARQQQDQAEAKTRMSETQNQPLEAHQKPPSQETQEKGRLSDPKPAAGELGTQDVRMQSMLADHGNKMPVVMASQQKGTQILGLRVEAGPAGTGAGQLQLVVASTSRAQPMELAMRERGNGEERDVVRLGEEIHAEEKMVVQGAMEGPGTAAVLGTVDEEHEVDSQGEMSPWEEVEGSETSAELETFSMDGYTPAEG